MSKIVIELQIESTALNIPSQRKIRSWLMAALKTDQADITVRVVDEDESAFLNTQYRNKVGPTNVLSFDLTSKINTHLQGDIVICAPIVIREAAEQHKTIEAHFAHVTIHGALHLQGFDHIDAKDACMMEAEEIAILAKLGISSPYG